MAVSADFVVTAGPRRLHGDLTVPSGAGGVVLFAHGSGSSRHSPRNRYVAERLNDRRLATLLLDLLEPDEERERRNVFDIDLLADRLVTATSVVADDPAVRDLPIGYFGASTGAAAALAAAAWLADEIGAVVSRGGRPDLAIGVLDRVTAPTVLIVGGEDRLVLDLNQKAREHLRAPDDLVVIPGATHLFEEPGALERVAELAGGWFVQHLLGMRGGSDEPIRSSYAFGD